MAELKNTIVNGVLNVNGDLIASKIIKRGDAGGILRGNGSVIAMGTGSSKFLREDGTWATVSTTDTGATSIEVTGTGNAVTTASYDASTRKITLTKGSTFLTSHQSLANYVTLNGDQTITGIKTFSHSTFGAIILKRNGSTNASSIIFQNNNGVLGSIGMTSTVNSGLKRWSADTSSSYTIWDSGNDGSGSGLDADKLDGQEGSYYLNYNNFTNKPTIPTVNNATLTIQKNGTTIKTFTANASTDVTANITVPTKTSELTNDSGFWTGTKYWANVAVSGSSSTATTPSVQKIGITGSTTTTAAAAVTMEYDSSYKALKFVFA